MSADGGRVRVRVEGAVQGVGFRPHVYRLAVELGLAGFVRNDARGVEIEVEGPAAAIDALLERVGSQAPPLAVVERVAVVERGVAVGARGFVIAPSIRGASPAAPVSADAATCEACLAELADPRDRRHRYPFINCTDCGPRFTIVLGVPYDRPLTTMASLRMCAACQAEYDDPADRRFHAQPNACPACGPRVALLDGAGAPLGDDGALDPVAVAAARLRAGAILAVKGIGGYHLACRADDERAVAALRERKHRADRPFALMARDLRAAGALVELPAAAAELLCAPARPIVVAERRRDAPVTRSVAPGLDELGVMLPYAPLHHLLLADAGGALVMTSANVSDEPIAYRDEEALARLAGIADLFLVHDRPIATPVDDSVLRPDGAGAPIMLRRSRGHVPASLPLPGSARPLLACGADLKNTFCVAKGGRAWVSHHIGDLANAQARRSLGEGIAHFRRLFDVIPELVAYDPHPGYASSAYALALEDVELIAVQHHHAHLAACLAEHGVAGPAVGAIFDGTGYGLDGTVWGGELLVGGLAGFERAGSLRAVRMPGGEAAVREPWRMACAWLADAFGVQEPPRPARVAAFVDAQRWGRVAALATRPAFSPLTTSAGRLFDAVAALCGVCPAAVGYEGQAATLLEAAAARAGRAGAYEIELAGSAQDGLVLDPRAALRAIVDELERGASAEVVAARFHAGLGQACAAACRALAARAHVSTVVLAGGVFQNRLLLGAVAGRLERDGLAVLVPRRLPPGDGAISYGQAAVAAARA